MNTSKTEAAVPVPKPKPKQRVETLSDEQLRRTAAASVAEQLAIATKLVARCEEWSLTDTIDPLGTLHAAARLMRSGAHIADAFAALAQVESRRRSIVERIEPVDPKQRELIERKKDQLHGAKVRQKVINRMNEHIEQSIRARLGEPGVGDSVARLVKNMEQDVARCQREVDQAQAG